MVNRGTSVDSCFFWPSWDTIKKLATNQKESHGDSQPVFFLEKKKSTLFWNYLWVMSKKK